jgi:hypothetical protein
LGSALGSSPAGFTGRMDQLICVMSSRSATGCDALSGCFEATRECDDGLRSAACGLFCRPSQIDPEPP